MSTNVPALITTGEVVVRVPPVVMVAVPPLTVKLETCSVLVSDTLEETDTAALAPI